MKSHLISACVLALGLAAFAEDKKPPVGTYIIDTTVDEITADFKKDADKAKTKYNPNPPKGVLGGALINLSGVIKDVGNGFVTLKNDNGIKLTVKVNNIPKNANNKTLVKISGAKFVSYKDGEIVIEVEKAEFTPIIGEDKK